MRKKKKKRKKEDDEMRLFRWSVSQLPRTQSCIHKYFYELLGGIISLCMLGLGFVASLAIIQVIHNYGKFKISVAIPK